MPEICCASFCREIRDAGAHKLMGLTLFFYENVMAEHELSVALQKDPARITENGSMVLLCEVDAYRSGDKC